MAKSVLHTIEDNLSTFSKGQKRIGRYILDHYDQAAFMTGQQAGKVDGGQRIHGGPLCRGAGL